MTIRKKLGRLFRSRRQELEMETELQFHLNQLAEEFMAEGLDRESAERAAKKEFGPMAVYKEQIWDSWRPPALADIHRSFQLALRSLRRSPGFTAIAILTLALGIGANTGMFSVMNSIMIRPLPYGNSEGLDRIYRATPENPKGAISPADLLDLRQEAEAYGEIAVYAYVDMTIVQPGKPADLTHGIRVSSNYFDTLQVTPILGRSFSLEEEILGNHRVLLLSYATWQRQFGGEFDVIGRTVRVNGEPHEIIGVLPESYSDWRYMGHVDIFRPLGLTPEETQERAETTMHLIGRPHPHLDREESHTFLSAISEKLAGTHPEVNEGSYWWAQPLNLIVADAPSRGVLSMIVGLSGFVLLIGCSNLANLMLARTIARSREFAMRSALGASRLQLLKPLVLEALILSLMGGVLAVLVAVWVTDWLTLASTNLEGDVAAFYLDWRVLAWALAASVATAIAFSLAPGLFAMRIDVNEALKSGGRTVSPGRGHQRLSKILIIGQFAMAMILLAGAALYGKGLHDATSRRFGWDSQNLITGQILLPEGTYPDQESIRVFHQETLEKLEALPGAVSASISYYNPFLPWHNPQRFVPGGKNLPEPGREPLVEVNAVTPRYFETMGTPVHTGRGFLDSDTLNSPKVFIINQYMAEAFFPGENPIGQQVGAVDESGYIWGEVVGVASNVQSVFPDTQQWRYQLYTPMAQALEHRGEIAVKTNGADPEMLLPLIRQTMTEMDPDLPLRYLRTADTAVEDDTYQQRVLYGILSGLAYLGLGLAALGIYGVISRTIVLRTGEFGIRLAIGARVHHIMRMVLISGLKLSLAGAGIGIAGAYGFAHLIVMAFPGLNLDIVPVIFGTALVLIFVSLAASFLPSRRASRISPTEALRAE